MVLLWLAVAYFGIGLYGQLVSLGASAFYSEEVDATCVIERRADNMAMACMPGNRLIDKEPRPNAQ